MYGCKAAEKKEIEKDSSKAEMPIILSKEIILGHPCIPCARLTMVTIRDGIWEQGGGAGGGGGGGGAETGRKGLKEDLI